MLLLLRYGQARTFRRAEGVIFLTRYAEQAVRAKVFIPGSTCTIPHGVSPDFFRAPKPQERLSAYSPERPFRLLYVSIIDVYKHQWVVAKAVSQLRRRGLPIQARFVGPAYDPAVPRLERTLAEEDPTGSYLRWVGQRPHRELPEEYANSDLFVFASSCENMPNILVEAMASGVPIACSNRGPSGTRSARGPRAT